MTEFGTLLINQPILIWVILFILLNKIKFAYGYKTSQVFSLCPDYFSQVMLFSLQDLLTILRNIHAYGQEHPCFILALSQSLETTALEWWCKLARILKTGSCEFTAISFMTK